MFIPDVDVTDDVVVNRHILAHDKSAITTKIFRTGRDVKQCRSVGAIKKRPKTT